MAARGLFMLQSKRSANDMMHPLYTTRVGKWVFTLCSLLLIVLFSLCQNHQSHILVAGAGFAEYSAKPCYWDNGVRTELEDELSGYAYAVTMHNNDIYVAGYIRNKANEEVPCYWKNGKRTELSKPDQLGYAKAIVVSGSDVYVAGYTASAFAFVPCYWKNGTRTDLSSKHNGRPGNATAICIEGQDVYVAGYTNDSLSAGKDASVPCYWKNGIRTDLSKLDSNHYGYAKAIVVANGHCYVAGNTEDESGHATPCIWKNEVRTDLLPSKEKFGSGYINGISISGMDVIVAGTVQDTAGHTIPVYWTNGRYAALPLANEYRDGYVNDVRVAGNETWCSGYIEKAIDDKIPCYWKNGVRIPLHENGQRVAVYGLYVSP
jgi:hypothetical protein